MQQKSWISRHRIMTKIIHHFFSFTILFAFMSAAHSAGYTCPAYKKYTSCTSGYYVDDCGTTSSGWDGRTLTESQLTVGNACRICPSGYTCTGARVCPKRNEVTITYNLNGGSGTTPASKTCIPGTSCSLASGATTTFYRAGYVFKGWSTSSTATTGSSSLTFSADDIVYAVWTACVPGTYKRGSGTQASATCSACVTGSYNTVSGSSTCTPCTRGTTTSGTGQTSCNAVCANATDSEGDDAVRGWDDNVSWNASSNTVTNLCRATSCAGGINGHYLSDGNCLRCDSFANGLYPRSSNGGNTKGKEGCFLYTADIPGQYIASKNDTVATDCDVGTYSAGSDNYAVHYGETSACDTCPDNTYADEKGLSACIPCLENYTTYGEKISASACRISCPAGSYLATVNATTCSDVGPGFWSEQAYVTQGNTGTRNACPNGLTTIGYGRGADELTDCGRVLNIEGNKLYLRSGKKTDLALNVNIDGTTYYGNMSTDDMFMSDGVEHSLKINLNGVEYSVYDDSAEFYSGGESGTITINPSVEASSIVPSSYNAGNGLDWSATMSDGTKLTGVGGCDTTTGENGDVSESGFTPGGTGTGCWCKLTSPAQSSRWVYGTTNANCSTKCGYFCANNMKGTSTKNITYRTNLYEAAGIATH